MKKSNTIRFAVMVILTGISTFVLLVCLCRPEFMAEVISSQPGLLGLVIGGTGGILVGYLIHHSKTSPTIKKMKKRISYLAKEHSSDLEEIGVLQKENQFLRQKFDNLELELKHANLAKIARQSRTENKPEPTFEPTSEQPSEQPKAEANGTEAE